MAAAASETPRASKMQVIRESLRVFAWVSRTSWNACPGVVAGICSQTALDPRAEYDIFKRFLELTRGKTTVLISHRFSTVRMADTIYVFHQGRIVERGSHRQLMALGGQYAELFNMQAEGYLKAGEGIEPETVAV